MTAENNLNIKPLTPLLYVAPTNKSDEQPGRNNRRYKQRATNPLVEESEKTINDDGDDTLHVIDYCA
ncbi:MAG: hypothetical protein Q7T18_11650 [Sedimentisphaerales bacterium]|nr:hypothetical protein [Sedimentisphaerales bacterium]